MLKNVYKTNISLVHNNVLNNSLWLRITNELCKVYLSHKPSIKSKVQTKNVEKSTQNTVVKNKNNVVIKRPTIR